MSLCSIYFIISYYLYPFTSFLLIFSNVFCFYTFIFVSELLAAHETLVLRYNNNIVTSVLLFCTVFHFIVFISLYFILLYLFHCILFCCIVFSLFSFHCILFSCCFVFLLFLFYFLVLYSILLHLNLMFCIILHSYGFHGLCSHTTCPPMHGTHNLLATGMSISRVRTRL